MIEKESFEEKRERLNELVMEKGNLQMKRFFNLDMQVYEEGALSKKNKELLGLVASLVLKCDDCVEYHLNRCSEEGVSDEEMMEALSIGLVVGGSITIPHLREAVEKWTKLEEE
ncbi:MAG: carboxymuconolactone decarboxylase family protein [Candidatus Thermoplasmatota archaeon]|nr:carboxymuconolactone decarboxylase family protein [Candidatus Thermoplasmatota archaeon]MBS3789722.1 carboxymuconolactone decarboxylase family protein [Candidatus Thermoplasmatota archaeon]